MGNLLGPPLLTLSIEQEFNLKLYRSQVPNLERSELEKSLLEVMRQAMVKDNIIRQLLKNGSHI